MSNPDILKLFLFKQTAQRETVQMAANDRYTSKTAVAVMTNQK